MKKESQVHMLPTKDKTNITVALHYNNRIRQVHDNYQCSSKNELFQHLYITVSQEVEPIKKGGWLLRVDSPYGPFKSLGKGVANDARKIIATTDTLKLQVESFEFGSPQEEEYVPQIEQSVIKEYCDKGGIDKVLVEYVKYHGNKTNSIQNDAETIWDGSLLDVKLKLSSDNTIIITPVEERVYSRAEMLSYGEYMMKLTNSIIKDNRKKLRMKPLDKESGPLLVKDLLDNWISKNL